MKGSKINKMEIFENSLLIFHKINLICMLMGILWTFVTAIIFKRPVLGFYSPIVFLVPGASALLMSLIPGTHDKDSNIIPNKLYISMLVFQIAFALLIIVSVILERRIFGYFAIALFATFYLFFKNKKVGLVDERLTTIIHRSQFIALQVLLYLILAIFIANRLGLRIININLLALSIVYILWGVYSASFLFLYKRN